MGTNIETLAKADWDAMEQEVVAKIRVLKLTSQKLTPDPLSDKIANDLILPCLELLANFCAAVTIGEE